MKKCQAKDFLKEEIRRLVDDEHVVDLFKKKRAKKLRSVKCMTNKAITDYINDNLKIRLSDEEIPEGGCVAIVVWGASSFAYNEQLFANVKSFAHRLAKEGGPYGKSIAFQILNGVELYDIESKDLFSDKFAKEYDEKYKFETK